MASKRFLIVPEELVSGEDPLAGSDHGLGDFVQFGEIHRIFLI